jgi:hypothetical protein
LLVSAILSITYDDGAAITPSDVTPQASSKAFAAFYSGAGGTVVLVTVRGSTLTLVSVPAGVIVPIAFSQIKATGTTATSLIGLRAMPYLGVA